MSNSQNTSEVILSLELDTSLRRLLDLADSLYEAVHRALVASLAEIMKALGIPGTAVVQITAPREKPLRTGQFLRVYVNGQGCRYSDELLRHVYSYVNNSYLDPQATPDNIRTWLDALPHSELEVADLGREKVIEFLNLTCLEIIKMQPAVLLGLNQVRDYIAALPDPGSEVNQQSKIWPPDPTWLLPILKVVLDLKISIADKESVAHILGKAQERSQEDIIEELITALRPAIIEIQITPDYLRQITTFDQENGPGLFTLLRTGLFEELGVRYPTFRFVPIDNLKPNSFAFKINHLMMLPFVGLRSNQCLVNETASRLQLMNIQGTATNNPATDMEGSLIDLSLQDVVVSAGLTKWNQIDYLILVFASILRANSKCFLYHQAVQDQLDQLKPDFPTLITAVSLNVPIAQITRVLRALVAEEISVRNLRLILEKLLEYNYSVAGFARHTPAANGHSPKAPPSSLPENLHDSLDLLSFVRAGMKNQIRQKYSRGASTVVVYLLAQEIEELLAEHLSFESGEIWRTRLGEDERDKIIEAIRAELAYLPPTVTRPIILTTDDVRASLREVIASEWPQIHVISYQDLPRNMNVQPVARISLNT